MATIMFETFAVPALIFLQQSILSLYSSGRTTGTVLYSGDTVTEIAPMIDGFLQHQAITSLSIAGRELTQCMMRLIKDHGHYLGTTSRFEIARDLKEKHCYVASDYAAEMEKAPASSELKITYEMPDHQMLTIGNERFRCMEPLFQPRLADLDESPLHMKLHESILNCDVDKPQDLYSSIILSGGTTLAPGFTERLKNEAVATSPPNIRIRMVADPLRDNSVWIGGSIFASLDSIKDIWVTKKQYDESGPSIIHQKHL